MVASFLIINEIRFRFFSKVSNFMFLLLSRFIENRKCLIISVAEGYPFLIFEFSVRRGFIWLEAIGISSFSECWRSIEWSLQNWILAKIQWCTLFRKWRACCKGLMKAIEPPEDWLSWPKFMALLVIALMIIIIGKVDFFKWKYCPNFVSMLNWLGCIKFLESYYLVLVTKRRQIGSLCGHAIYSIDESQIITIPHVSVQTDLAHSKTELR